jgi:predicted nucleic acid-binding protein
VAVAVFDADVLIAYLGRHDAHHRAAVDRMRQTLEPGTRRFVSAVNYAELLIGPLEAGGEAATAIVDAMFTRLRIETIEADAEIARRAAAVRVQTRLKLPDAFAVATALDAEARGADDVRLESFDRKVVEAYAHLH